MKKFTDWHKLQIGKLKNILRIDNYQMLWISFLKGLLLGFLICILFRPCSKSECNDSVKGKLVNLTGLEGCGWMIELNNGNRLEPRNLSDFNIELKESKKVWVSYHNPLLAGTICMADEIIDIDCITER